MLLSIPALSAADIAIAVTPEIGAETIVKYSPEEFTKLFEIEQTGAGDTDFTTDGDFTGGGLDVDAAGKHLHLRVENGAKGGDDIAVTMAVTYDDDTSGTLVGTLAVPSWVTNTDKVWPVGLAVDFAVPTGRTVKSIQSVDTVTNGLAGRLNRFTVWSSPAAADFYLAGATREKEGPYQLPATVDIADRYNPTQWTKKGRAEQQDLRIQFPWVSEMEHLARMNGHRCTVLMAIVKDDQVPFGNVIYTGFRPNAGPSRGDGDDEVIATAEGSYETFFTFIAG